MDGMKPGTRTHGGASLRLAFNTTVPAHLRGGLLEVSHLHTDAQQRNRGQASMLLQKVCAEADEAGKVLLLRPKAYDDGVLGEADLVDWYSRYGFDVIQLDPVLMARPAHAAPRFKARPTVFTMEAAHG